MAVSWAGWGDFELVGGVEESCVRSSNSTSVLAGLVLQSRGEIRRVVRCTGASFSFEFAERRDWDIEEWDDRCAAFEDMETSAGRGANTDAIVRRELVSFD